MAPSGKRDGCGSDLVTQCLLLCYMRDKTYKYFVIFFVQVTIVEEQKGATNDVKRGRKRKAETVEPPPEG